MELEQARPAGGPDAPDVLLSERHAERAAVFLEMARNVYCRNGQAPDDDMRSLAAQLATGVQLAAVKLPAVLAGLQAATAAKAEAGRMSAMRSSLSPGRLAGQLRRPNLAGPVRPRATRGGSPPNQARQAQSRADRRSSAPRA